MSSGAINLVTGDINSGKTRLCLEISRIAKENDLDVAGIISEGVFYGEQKTAINARDLRTGESRKLADLLSGEKTGLETQRWSFYPDAVSWGNQILLNAVPCDLLIVDELGPLEFLRQQGWMAAFTAIDSKDYQAAVIVIRPSLLEAANERWDIKREINLNKAFDQSLLGYTFLADLGLPLDIG